MTKGYLRNTKDAIAKQWISTGILSGLCVALVAYGLTIQVKEAFRLFTLSFHSNLLVHTVDEDLFYKVLYALISSIIGCSFAIKFIVHKSRNRRNFKIRIRQSHAINDQNYNTGFWIYWVSKVFTLTGFWYISMPMQYDISFYDDFKLFFILLVVVWFLNLWLNMHQLLGHRTFKWMGIALGIIIVNSFLLTHLNIVDSDKINNNILRNTIAYNYRVNKPTAMSYNGRDRRRSLKIPMYLGFSKQTNKATVVAEYGYGDHKVLSMDEVSKFLINEKNYVNRIERDQMYVVLHVDSLMPYHLVQQLKQNISQGRVNELVYATPPAYSKYPNDYPPHHNIGIHERLPWDCSRLVTQIDSLKALGYTAGQVRFSKWHCYRSIRLSEYNRVKVNIGPKGELTLNKSVIKPEELKNFLIKFVRKYKANFVIIFDPDDSCTYGQYIHIKDIIRSSIIYVKNEIAIERYGNPYDISRDIRDPDHYWMKDIDKEVPMNILDMNPADKALYEFVKGK